MAFQMVADMLSEKEVSWLLEKMPEAIYDNHELLKGLSSYGSFTENHVLCARQSGFDWFAHPRAFDTLPLGTILKLIETCDFDLSDANIAVLLNARSGELVRQKKFVSNRHMWMAFAETRHANVNRVQPERLVQEIESLNLTADMGDNVSTWSRPSQLLHMSLLAYCIHSELEIVRALGEMIRVFFKVLCDFQETDREFVEETLFEREVSASFGRLLCILDARSSVIKALSSKSANKVISSVMALFKTPLMTVLRVAVRDMHFDLAEIKQWYSEAPWNLVLYHRLLATCKTAQHGSNKDSSAPIAFSQLTSMISNIFAVTQLNTSTRVYESASLMANSSLRDMTKLWIDASGFELHLFPGKWTRMFLFQLSADFEYLCRDGFSSKLTETREEMVNMLLKCFQPQETFVFSDCEIEHLRSVWESDAARQAFVTGVEGARRDSHTLRLIRDFDARALQIAVVFAKLAKNNMKEMVESGHKCESEAFVVSFSHAQLQLCAKVECMFVALGTTLSERVTAHLKTSSLAKLFLNCFPEALSRTQIQSLLGTVEGRQLLASNSPLLHGLRTYEDMTAEDLREFGFQMDMARSKWTLSLSHVLDCLKRTEFLSNGPSELVWGLGRAVVQSAELYPHLWRFLSLSTLLQNHEKVLEEFGTIYKMATSGKPTTAIEWLALAMCIADNLEKSDVSHSEMVRTILHWLIQMEGNLVHFRSIHSPSLGTSEHIRNIYVLLLVYEAEERQKLRKLLKTRLENAENAAIKNDLLLLSKLLSVPLSSIRAGMLLIANDALRVPDNLKVFCLCADMNDPFSMWISVFRKRFTEAHSDAVTEATASAAETENVSVPVPVAEPVKFECEAERLAKDFEMLRSVVLENVNKSINELLKLLETHSQDLSERTRDFWSTKLRGINLISADMVTINPGFTYGWLRDVLDAKTLTLDEAIQLTAFLAIGGVRLTDAFTDVVFGASPDTPLVSPPSLFDESYKLNEFKPSVSTSSSENGAIPKEPATAAVTTKKTKSKKGGKK